MASVRPTPGKIKAIIGGGIYYNGFIHIALAHALARWRIQAAIRLAWRRGICLHLCWPNHVALMSLLVMAKRRLSPARHSIIVR